MCRIDKLVNEHLRIQRKWHVHTLFFGYKAPKKFVAFHLTLPMLQKIVQFNKWMGNIWGIWCKGDLMFNDGCITTY
jgi:hypothetical protein